MHVYVTKCEKNIHTVYILPQIKKVTSYCHQEAFNKIQPDIKFGSPLKYQKFYIFLKHIEQLTFGGVLIIFPPVVSFRLCFCDIHSSTDGSLSHQVHAPVTDHGGTVSHCKHVDFT